MSDTKDNGGPAFPNEGFNGWGTPWAGMTLRDYFAAKAMHALMTNPNNGASLDFAKYAYAYADLMLKAREQ